MYYFFIFFFLQPLYIAKDLRLFTKATHLFAKFNIWIRNLAQLGF